VATETEWAWEGHAAEEKRASRGEERGELFARTTKSSLILELMLTRMFVLVLACTDSFHLLCSVYASRPLYVLCAAGSYISLQFHSYWSAKTSAACLP
jgi:hypothetical protein